MSTEVEIKEKPEKSVDTFTSYVCTKYDLTYEYNVEKNERSANPVNIEQVPLKENDKKYQTLKEAMQAFLRENRYDPMNDGQVFYIKQENATYFGFSRTSVGEGIVHDYLALFAKVDTEVTTVMTASLVDVDMLKEAISE